MFGQHPRIWALAAGILGLIGVYGVLVGILGAAFWPARLSSSDAVVALPLALLVAYAIGALVRYHLVHGLGTLASDIGKADGNAPPARVRIALFVLIAYVGLVAGEGITLVIYGSEGPFSYAFTGLASHAPVLPVWTWPIAFAVGAGLMHWICWAAINQMHHGSVKESAA